MRPPASPPRPPPAVRALRPERASQAARLLAGLVLLVLTGCAHATNTPAPTKLGRYALTAPTLRTGEAPAAAGVTRTGHLLWRVLGLTVGLPSVFGTHAELSAQGQFVRVRLQLEVDDSTFHDVASTDIRILDTVGRTYPASRNALLVKRQPLDLNVGARDILAFDVYADLPVAAVPASIRLPGDDGPAVSVALPRASPVGAPG
jgi:hypothetical protein